MIGHKIRQFRKELAISQATLATEISITVEAIRNIENDIGSLQTLQTVLTALELELTGLPLVEGLGEQLKSIRRSRKYSQRHVCEMTGLTQPTLINLENGRGRLSSFYTVLTFYKTSLSVRKQRRLHYKKGKTDSWNTSRDFLEKIHSVVPKFCLDPATNPDSHVVAQTHFYEEDDGLKQPWNAQNVYLNPPYSTLEAWITKAHDEFHKGNAETIIALLPCRTNTEYFHTLITPSADVLFIQKRLRFGKARQQAPFASMLAVWSKTNIIDEFARHIEGTILRKPEIAAVAE
ncbi:DNA N-6-adenine-methyltransferase [Terasakiella sp.]|uniref:DNA N-6-adenine-methyltransferase n=1 Tax=Terasakiella sp. TaxID=2034861 RepID=UPI003AA82585